jgi:hypothetical protein
LESCFAKQVRAPSDVYGGGWSFDRVYHVDALKVSALSHIILDVTYQDSKKRSLLDIPETRDEVFKTVLGGPAVLAAIKQGKIQVIIF